MESKDDGAKEKARLEREEELAKAAAAAEAEFNEMLDMDDEEEEQHGGGISDMIERFKDMIAEASQEFTKNFVDYGPPYYPQEETYSLINECADHKLHVFTIHGLLNQRFDPNLRDPEDLFYTASHWAARNAHLVALRMLKRAGADFEMTNEFGQSVLHMACIVKQPPDKHKTQIKMVDYLCEFCECNVNVRDKGGYCALDYACMNNDFEVIKRLIKYGSEIYRENDTLVAKRKALLDMIEDPDCYRLIQLAKKRYEEDFLIKRKEAKEARRLLLKEKRAKQREEEHIQRKMEELQKKKADEKLAYQEKIKKDRDERIRKSLMQLTNQEELRRYGEYRRSSNGKWSWFDKKTQITAGSVYDRARGTMKELRDKNKRAIYNSRWEEVTNGGELEMPWRMSTAFDLDTLSDDDVVEDQEEEKSEYDENDEALQGMDLDDALF